MAFRDDRDAQLARAAALERENRRLEEELARHKAEAVAAGSAKAAAEARDLEAAAARRHAALAKENAELREELARARGPGMLRRAGAWIARLRLDRPSGDGGYWRGALEAWRILVPLFAGLIVTAPFLGARAIVVALGVPVAAVALAVVVLLVPWLLRRRRRAIAGAIAGGASGLAASLALADRLFQFDLTKVMGLTVVMVVVAIGGMVLTRALRWTSELAPIMIFSPFMVLLVPVQILVVTALAGLGADLAEPPAERD